jgi:hypothetical protein
MRDNAGLWIDDTAPWGSRQLARHDWILSCADDWNADGAYQDRAEYIKHLRLAVQATRRKQSDVFAAIRAYGCMVRKTDCNEYRVADASVTDVKAREDGAAYCDSLADALGTAQAFANHREQVATRAARQAELMAAHEAAMPITGGIAVINAINLTPTWAAVLPVLITAIEIGTDEGRRLARQELARMAQAADQYNASIPV